MNSTIAKRLDKLEQSLKPPQTRETALIAWPGTNAELEAKLERWRAGEDFEGAPTDIKDRMNAFVILIRGITAEKDET